MNKKKMLIAEDVIAKAINRLIETANPSKLYLFGSYARGDARKHSDLDFLLLELLQWGNDVVYDEAEDE